MGIGFAMIARLLKPGKLTDQGFTSKVSNPMQVLRTG